MVLEELSKNALVVHRQMAESLKEALDSSNPLSAVRELSAEWLRAHDDLKRQRQELRAAIRRAEAHFKFDAADELRTRLQALG